MALGFLLALGACGDDGSTPPDAGPDAVLPDGGATGALRINELMSRNDGVWVDEIGQTDDWVELVNAGSDPLPLGAFRIGDADDELAPLPNIILEPGQTVLFWADGDVDQGAFHLPFRLDGDGERVVLATSSGFVLDAIDFPALDPNVSFARVPHSSGDFSACRYATPSRDNGETCGPPPPPEIPPEVEFDPYTWPDPWPAPEGPLVLSELALRPAAFVEVLNTSAAPVDLTGYTLNVAPQGPGEPWPGATDGTALPLGTSSLAPGERIAVPVVAADIAELALDPLFEGVVTLWEAGRPIDRIDFMRWPDGAALTRIPDGSGHPVFCAATTPDAANDPCDPLASRDVGDRIRHLSTPGDYAALAAGGTEVGQEAVKFIVDMAAGDVVHLLSSRWDLHYTFIRENIYREPHLDRCDPEEGAIFRAGWVEFSRREYFEVEGRRFLLGTLVHHSGPGIHTVEYVTGDRITGELMRRGFFDVVAHLDDPTEWAVRPEGAEQIEKVLPLEGTLPLIDPNAPFRGLIYQPLTEAVAFGWLRFIPAAELPTAALGFDTIALTDDVPNDMPFLGGLVTEAFQTPLSHVNILSRNRSTPNMALRDAREALADHLDTLVRLEVAAGGYEIRPATPEEAEAFWESRRPTGEPLRPGRDLSVRGIQPLSALDLTAIPSVGAKAAQLAELMRVVSTRELCPGPLPVPRDGFAIPIAHYVDHFEASGARALLESLQADPVFRTDPAVRATGLAQVQAAILDHPIDAALLDEVRSEVVARYGSARVRFRSSSNTEDLQAFSGAGLYTSVGTTVSDDTVPVEDAIRTVWASLWSPRAYDERTFGNVDQSLVAMGVLVHQAYPSERANGVGISRNILDPIRGDMYYINAQVGEALVTNPAPGVASEQGLYQWGRSPRVLYQARSSLTSRDVMTLPEYDRVACVLAAIHTHFRPRIDPGGENRWFAMDIEFKLMGEERALVVKQARPYSFGRADIPPDCREF